MSIVFSAPPDEGEVWMHPGEYARLYKEQKITVDRAGIHLYSGHRIVVDARMPEDGIYAGPTPSVMRERMAADTAARLRRSITSLCESYGVSLAELRAEAEKGEVVA